MQKRVKVVATVGPACENMLGKLIKAGADCIRINTAYADVEYYERIIQAVRKTGDTPVMLDLKGTDIRLRLKQERMVKQGVQLRVGFLKGEAAFSKSFAGFVKKGDSVFFKDGSISAVVVAATRTGIDLKFTSDGRLYDGVGVNIPRPLEFSSLLSAHDRDVLKLAKSANVEFVALSFTKSAKDVLAVRRALGDDSVMIIAKIESGQGVSNAEEIVDAADGIMVARGDLGVELPAEYVPIIQKKLIGLANAKGKIVITATQMLQSMVDSPQPTRAETSDVANAILDGTDAVMLSAETSIGKFPVKAVEEMGLIAEAIEPHLRPGVSTSGDSVADLITGAVSHFCASIDLEAIVTITRSGYTTRMIARFRNNEPLIAVTRDAKVARQLHLVFGAIPVHFAKLPEANQMRESLRFLVKSGVLKKQGRVGVTAGLLTKSRGTNSVSVFDVADIV